MKTLKYAWRFLMRSKSYTIINLLGLAFSLACSIILMRYIHRELTVDTHCIDREHVYAICTNTEGNRGLSGLKQYNYDTISIDNRFVEAMTTYLHWKRTMSFPVPTVFRHVASLPTVYFSSYFIIL